ncbi:DUF4232 domain-containing protein [Streptomonospora sp. S1-112]|uniref:DUF4232 domain-containing protein n=1 Tax=Streptomonospora mangrovi TaxID=2883123 RepID=A0A9X3SCL6_9ACTN|nr:DUF4232 domain-containing protein [Streptomonospora mangrovi]MDA0563818.1 DUF4232 domain-containing protein [Streptomonospora mangrovi]
MTRAIRARSVRAAALGALALPALLLAAPSAAADTAAGAGALSVRDCTAVDLEVAETAREGAAGTVYVEFELTKREPLSPWDDEACVMYPAVADMYWGDSEGNPIGAHAVREGQGGDVFALYPGDTAVVTVARPNPDAYAPEDCRPTEVAGAHLFFQNDEGAEYAPTGGADRVCANPDLGASTISAVTPA